MFGGTLSPVQIHKPQEILEPDCVVYIEIILLLKPLVTQSGAVVRGKKDKIPEFNRVVAAVLVHDLP